MSNACARLPTLATAPRGLQRPSSVVCGRGRCTTFPQGTTNLLQPGNTFTTNLRPKPEWVKYLKHKTRTWTHIYPEPFANQFYQVRQCRGDRGRNARDLEAVGRCCGASATLVRRVCAMYARVQGRLIEASMSELQEYDKAGYFAVVPWLIR